ncbi:M10 family metallopeptidase C-terminal domain-containing protein [Inquilinus sp. OTU3971]|uniref:M10 family metallopeptidase C-terminal domain-containing protein n=1 Tax=Inquilinus sp. OTU3971 TaxID=3043855 RepID=UPI00313CBEDB
MIGRYGGDVLNGDGGADRFVFSAASHSTGAAADRITDFSHARGDRVDLSAIDANTGAAGNQAFSFIGSGAFTHQAGELRASVSGGVTTIAGDINGDDVSDFHIQLTGAIGLVAADFVL